MKIYFVWNLCGFEEGIDSPLMLPLQLSNKYLTEILPMACTFITFAHV